MTAENKEFEGTIKDLHSFIRNYALKNQLNISSNFIIENENKEQLNLNISCINGHDSNSDEVDFDDIMDFLDNGTKYSIIELDGTNCNKTDLFESVSYELA